MNRKRTCAALVIAAILAMSSSSWADTAKAAIDRGLQFARAEHFEQAVDCFSEAIRIEPGNVMAYIFRGTAFGQLKKNREALADGESAVSLDPRNGRAYALRGRAQGALGQYDKAVNDFTEAIRLGQNGFSGRASAYFHLADFTRALEDANEGLQRNPQDTYGRKFRSLVHFALGHGADAATDGRAFLEREGFRAPRGQSAYAVLYTYIGLRLAREGGGAEQLLDGAVARCNHETWPYPIIEYLKGSRSLQGLLEAANNPDRMTESRALVGITLSLAGQRDAAVPHLEWVRTNGAPLNLEFVIAGVELDRLKSAQASKAGTKLFLWISFNGRVPTKQTLAAETRRRLEKLRASMGFAKEQLPIRVYDLANATSRQQARALGIPEDTSALAGVGSQEKKCVLLQARVSSASDLEEVARALESYLREHSR